jgi:hypothetical protein
MATIGKLTAERVLAAMNAAGHRVFEGELNLNIVGVRNHDTKANTFNDAICVLYQEDGKWQIKQYKATTDAGLYYRENPINVDGTAVLVPGQHKSLWTLGYHQGKYKALLQHKPVLVLRDSNRDCELDNHIVKESILQQGYFGINCHRASASQESRQVDKWSAGCQVFANPKDYDEFIELCERSAEKYGPYFTYTLLEQSELEQGKANAKAD